MGSSVGTEGRLSLDSLLDGFNVDCQTQCPGLADNEVGVWVQVRQVPVRLGSLGRRGRLDHQCPEVDEPRVGSSVGIEGRLLLNTCSLLDGLDVGCHCPGLDETEVGVCLCPGAAGTAAPQ